MRQLDIFRAEPRAGAHLLSREGALFELLFSKRIKYVFFPKVQALVFSHPHTLRACTEVCAGLLPPFDTQSLADQERCRSPNLKPHTEGDLPLSDPRVTTRLVVEYKRCPHSAHLLSTLFCLFFGPSAAMNKRESSTDNEEPLSFKRKRPLSAEAIPLPPPGLRAPRPSPILANRITPIPVPSEDDVGDKFTRDFRPEVKLVHVWPKQSSMTQFDISELPDPSITSPAIPGSVRWLIRGEPPTGSRMLATVKLSLALQLAEHAPEAITARNVTINFPPFAERLWYVEAVFDTLEGYIAGRDAPLEWKGKTLRRTCAAAPIGSGKVMLKFTTLRASTDLSDFLNFLRKVLASAVTLTDLWVEYLTYSSKNPERPGTKPLPPRSLTGSLLVLAEYKEGQGPSQVPGFLRYDDLDQRLDFHGRGERCHYCKNSPTRKAHTYRMCVWKTCPHCSGRGHLEDDCSERFQRPRPSRRSA